MYRHSAVWSVIAAMTGIGCSPAIGISFQVDESLLPGVVKGNSEFAFDLYAKVAGNRGNLFFSPYSISTALAMTYAGAQGETQTEMRHVLKFPPEGEQLHACFGALLDRFTKEKARKSGYRLCVANRLWGEERPHFRFAEAFLNITRNYYFSELAKVSFSTDGAGACRMINDWAAEKTQQKIRELLQSGDLDGDTILVLTNAIYFKGDWAEKFQENATSDAPFYLNTADNVPVPLMHQTQEFGYMATDEFQALQMPYKGDTLSMVILLPTKRDGLRELEPLLSATWLDQQMGVLRKREVEVYLPRFKLEASLRLKDILTALGMPNAFDKNKAEFKAMIEYVGTPVGEDSIWISDVIHKAYVDVNEEGTEAAAATAVTMGYATTSAPQTPPVFLAGVAWVQAWTRSRGTSP